MDLAINFCQTYGRLVEEKTCAMAMNNDCTRGDEKVWRCTDRSCYKKRSMSEGSFFKGSKLSITQILGIIYEWCYKGAIVQDLIREVDLAREAIVN